MSRVLALSALLLGTVAVAQPPAPPPREVLPDPLHDPKLDPLLAAAAGKGKGKAHKPALDWIDERSKYIVKQVLAEEFNAQAVDVTQWSPLGIIDLMEGFERFFPGQSYWDFDYLAYHQERLKLRAKQAGVDHVFGKRLDAEEMLVPHSVYYIRRKWKEMDDKMIEKWDRWFELYLKGKAQEK